MQFNYYFLKALSPALNKKVAGTKIVQIFSQSRNELILIFNGDNQFVIKANLDNESSLLSFPDDFARARKNSVNLFEELLDQEVLNIRSFENERSFSIQLTANYELLFKLHGRHSNVILFKEGVFRSMFKQNMLNDETIRVDQLDRPIDQCDNQILSLDFDLANLFPTFDKQIKGRLRSDGFYDEVDTSEKLKILKQLFRELEQRRQYICSIDGNPQLLLFKPDQFDESFEDPIEASNAFARIFFKNTGFSTLKSRLLAQVRKEIKKCDSYLKQTKAKLTEIENRRGYDEIANILMANLHQPVAKGSKSIDLTDFYSNQTINIKIKSNLSLQQNAELLYRKAKNQGKEVAVLKQNIEAKSKSLKDLQARLVQIEGADDIKSLKALDQSANNSNGSRKELPFMCFIIEGYEVFAGRNAKNNDLLTQKFAKKDDLWLHARDVSGSHVIIRNPNGASIPNSVIEKVAQLAAWYSKRKTDSLCPVIYTPKKYVRKPKGSLPGQVILSQEKVVMVKPGKSHFIET